MFGNNSSRWSGPFRLAAAGLFAPRGLILGQAYNRLIRDDSDMHVLCVAETGAGKSTSFVLPNLYYGWDESVIVHDPSGELYDLSAAHRAKWTRVVHLNPLSRLSDCCNPLDAIRMGEDEEVRDAQLIAEMLTDAGMRGADHMGGGEAHFTEMSSEGIGGLMLYGKYSNRATSLPALNALIVQERWATLLRDMARYPHAAIQRAGRILEQLGGGNEANSIFSTLTRALRIYTDPLLGRISARSDFQWRDLRERGRPLSLYLTVPFSDRERLRPWIRLVVRSLLDYCTRELTAWRWRVLALIDEYHALGRMTVLHNALTEVRKYGLRLALITPTMQGIREEYGDRHQFYEGTHTKLAFGIRDTGIAQTVSGWVGERTRWHGVGPHRQSRREPLFPFTAVMNMPPRQVLIVAGTTRLLARQVHYTAVHM